MEYLREMEMALLQHEVRMDKTQLQGLLHPQFREIGYSGESYDYTSIVTNLTSEQPDHYRLWSQDYEYFEFSKKIVQLIYKQARLDQRGLLSRHAKRTSIWVNENGCWQLKFHQATPTLAFEKKSKNH